MGKRKHDRDSEIQSGVDVGIPRESAEALSEVARECAALDLDLKAIKAVFHNMYATATRDPEIKAKRAEARKADVPDIQVGDRVLALRNVKPRYLETIQGEVTAVIYDDITIKVDTYYREDVENPQEDGTVNWFIDPRASKFVRFNGEMQVKNTMVVTADIAPSHIKDGKPEKAAA